MQKIDNIKNNLQVINIYDRHTLEKFMLGKNVTVFDEKQNAIGKINIVEHSIPIDKEMKEAVKSKGFMYVLAFDSFNGSSNTENIRIINYFDFIEQKIITLIFYYRILHQFLVKLKKIWKIMY